MQLKKKESSAQYVDIKTFLKRYLQSYLSWLYLQNPEFSKTLTAEECTNFFLNEVVHPIWFQVYLKHRPLKLMSHINQYFVHNKDSAHLFNQFLAIQTKDDIEGLMPSTDVSYYAPAVGADKFWANMVAKNEHILLYTPVTNVDVKLLHQLNQKEKRRKMYE